MTAAPPQFKPPLAEEKERQMTLTTTAKRSRGELVIGYLRSKRQLAELIEALPDRELAADLGSLGEEVAWREAELAQELAGCDHDLDRACCKARAALDPEYWCDDHTGAPEVGFPLAWGMDDPEHVTPRVLKVQRKLLLDALAERNLLAIQRYRDDLLPVLERGADPRVRDEAAAQLKMVADWESENSNNSREAA